MIKEYLENQFKQNRLSNAVIISSSNSLQALEEVEAFAKNNLFNGNITHADYFVIKKNHEAKNISIDQIRVLQEFLNKTPIIYNYKLAVICDADLMTVNASNSCLKILEDTTKNTYIILMSKNSNNLLATIRSRCNIFKHNLYGNYIEDELYNEIIRIFASDEELLNFLLKFTEKNRDLWLNITNHILYLFVKFVKKSANFNVILNKDEMIIFNKLSSNNVMMLNQRFYDIKNFLKDTIEYDLDLKSSFIVISKFLKN